MCPPHSFDYCDALSQEGIFFFVSPRMHVVFAFQSKGGRVMMRPCHRLPNTDPRCHDVLVAKLPLCIPSSILWKLKEISMCAVFWFGHVLFNTWYVFRCVMCTRTSYKCSVSCTSIKFTCLKGVRSIHNAWGSVLNQVSLLLSRFPMEHALLFYLFSPGICFFRWSNPCLPQYYPS